jgi:hypothetical protein
MTATVICRACGVQPRAEARFCDACGARIEAPAAEYKQVTVLFAPACVNFGRSSACRMQTRTLAGTWEGLGRRWAALRPRTRRLDLSAQ